MKKELAMGMTLLAVSTLLAGCGNSSDSSAKNDNSTTKTEKSSKKEATKSESSKKETKAEEYVDGQKIVTKEYDMTVKSHKVIPVGQTGNEYGEKPVLAIWYSIHNKSAKDLDPSEWITIATAVQDNNKNSVNELEMGSLPDEQYLDSQMENIKIGGTVDNAIAYELDDTTTPVVVNFNSTLGFDDDFGKITFNIK